MKKKEKKVKKTRDNKIEKHFLFLLNKFEILFNKKCSRKKVKIRRRKELQKASKYTQVSKTFQI